MSKHVAQHFRANRPGLSPAVSAKHLDVAPIAKRIREHLRAANGALGQSRAGLLRRAARPVELRWNLQVRSCKPDPLGADIVHVREDRRNVAGLAGRFGSPGGRVKMFDNNLVYAIIGDKDPDRGLAELDMNLFFRRGQDSCSSPYNYVRVVGVGQRDSWQVAPSESSAARPKPCPTKYFIVPRLSLISQRNAQ